MDEGHCACFTLDSPNLLDEFMAAMAIAVMVAVKFAPLSIAEPII